MDMGKLYIVPTPVGNLEDMTFRAVEVLKKVSLIAAEDTRVSRKLLDHFEINTPLMAYHEHNEVTKVDEVLRVLKESDVALISDAGTPGVSDPGFKLISEAIASEIKIVPLPGATAFVPALVASGLATDKFSFMGFLPKKSVARVKFLEPLKENMETMIFYESPYRLIESLEDIEQVLGDRQICVAREVSKKFEEFIRGSVSQVAEYYKDRGVAGEICLIVDGLSKGDLVWDEARVVEELETLMKDKGLSTAAKMVAKRSGWKKAQVYELGLREANK